MSTERRNATPVAVVGKDCMNSVMDGAGAGSANLHPNYQFFVMRLISILLFLSVLNSACSQWVMQNKQVIKEAPDLTIPQDNRFIYYKAQGYSRNNVAAARVAAEQDLVRQVKRSVYLELENENFYLDDYNANQIAQRVIAVTGVIIEKNVERQTKELYRMDRLIGKDKYSELIMYEITLIARYPKADFLRAVRETLNDRR